MRVISEFREFIARGSVIDLAVGVIIGGAFNTIVTALVNGVLMPPIGFLTSGVDFTHLELVLKPDDPHTTAVETIAIHYGVFINAVVQFLIIAFTVFWIVKFFNILHHRKDAELVKEPAAPETSPTEALLAEIRDLLKEQRKG